jgi:hypothetical protein
VVSVFAVAERGIFRVISLQRLETRVLPKAGVVLYD